MQLPNFCPTNLWLDLERVADLFNSYWITPVGALQLSSRQNLVISAAYSRLRSQPRSTALYESHPTLETRESRVTAICLFFDLRAFSTAAQHAHRNRHHIWGLLIVHAKMDNGTQETSSTLIFGIASILIAFAALSIAYLQLRRMRRVHQIYELA